MNKQTRKTFTLTAIILSVAAFGLIATHSLQGNGGQQSSDTLGQVMQDATPAPAQNADPGSPLWTIVKMLSALTIVIAALYGGLYLLKRLMSNRRVSATSTAALEVIESTYVGPKKMVSLVRVGGKAVLVGVTDQQISMLTELSAEETTALSTAHAPVKTGETFGQLFKRTTEKFRESKVKKEHAIAEA